MILEPPDSVQKLQAALQAKAKGSPGYRFYLLYDKLYRKDVLEYAYRCCKANQGAPGVDQQDFADIEAYGEERWLRELAATLMTGRYFVRHELAEKGIKMRWAALGPVVLGTGLALLFFVGAGFGWWSTGWNWLLALTGVAVASAWGWKALDLDMRARLMDLPTRLIRRL
jgi:hypothetical protein